MGHFYFVLISRLMENELEEGGTTSDQGPSFFTSHVTGLVSPEDMPLSIVVVGQTNAYRALDVQTETVEALWAVWLDPTTEDSSFLIKMQPICSSIETFSCPI